MTPSYKDKQRINEYLYSYWESKRNGKPYPSEDDIDPAELSDIWDSCFLVKYNEHLTDENEFTYLYLGSTLLEAYGGSDETSHDICMRLIFPSSMSLVHKFREIVSSGKPATEEGEFLNVKKLLVKYRSNMLPLSDRNGKIRYIIGGMKWKLF